MFVSSTSKMSIRCPKLKLGDFFYKRFSRQAKNFMNDRRQQIGGDSKFSAVCQKNVHVKRVITNAGIDSLF